MKLECLSFSLHSWQLWQDGAPCVTVPLASYSRRTAICHCWSPKGGYAGTYCRACSD
jgi:hypothetical protein